MTKLISVRLNLTEGEMNALEEALLARQTAAIAANKAHKAATLAEIRRRLTAQKDGSLAAQDGSER